MAGGGPKQEVAAEDCVSVGSPRQLLEEILDKTFRLSVNDPPTAGVESGAIVLVFGKQVVFTR